MKAERVATTLNTFREELEKKCMKFEEKQEALEDRATEHDRDMTESEENRYYEFQDKIDGINDLISEIDSFLVYLESQAEELGL